MEPSLLKIKHTEDGHVEFYDDNGVRIVHFWEVLDLAGRDYTCWGDMNMTLKEEFEYTMEKNHRTPTEKELKILEWFVSRGLDQFSHVPLTEELQELIAS